MEELMAFNWSQMTTISSVESDSVISNIYSGPTITDIESALSVASYTRNSQDLASLTIARISDMERGMSKVDNKYTLKIKSGNIMADDGYKWRKYGQKSIKNSPNPRSYYKCTNPCCGAKKQVERSNDDPDTLIITYEGLHLHYTYPFFVFGQPENPNPPSKKFKKTDFEVDSYQIHQEWEESTRNDDQCTTNILDDYQQATRQPAIGSQGLLEDMVPLFIRNPFMYTTSTKSYSASPSTSP